MGKQQVRLCLSGSEAHGFWCQGPPSYCQLPACWVRGVKCNSNSSYCQESGRWEFKCKNKKIQLSNVWRKQLKEGEGFCDMVRRKAAPLHVCLTLQWRREIFLMMIEIAVPYLLCLFNQKMLIDCNWVTQHVKHNSLASLHALCLQQYFQSVSSTTARMWRRGTRRFVTWPFRRYWQPWPVFH